MRDQIADDRVGDPDRRALPDGRVVRKRKHPGTPGDEPLFRERVPLDPQRVDDTLGNEPRGEDAPRASGASPAMAPSSRPRAAKAASRAARSSAVVAVSGRSRSIIRKRL